VKSKYHSRKTTVDGITFDSIREANRYQELRLLERAGEIKDLELQPRFTLQEAFEIAGRHVRKIEYVADFAYVKDGRPVIEDVKGMKTDVYKIKKKLFEKQYNIEIKEV
jgi:hypothetical protein